MKLENVGAGQLVFWEDPSGMSGGEYEVARIYGDVIILEDKLSLVEVFAHEIESI